MIQTIGIILVFILLLILIIFLSLIIEVKNKIISLIDMCTNIKYAADRTAVNLYQTDYKANICKDNTYAILKHNTNEHANTINKLNAVCNSMDVLESQINDMLNMIDKLNATINKNRLRGSKPRGSKSRQN